MPGLANIVRKRRIVGGFRAKRAFNVSCGTGQAIMTFSGNSRVDFCSAAA